jgi:MFS family permease
LSLPVAITAYFLAIAQLSGVAGRILWGVISDRYWAGARKPVMMIIGMIIALMSLSMLLIRPGVPLWLVAVDIAVFGFSAIGWNGIWIALLSELVDKDHSGTAVGMGMTVLQIGVLIFPFLFGWLIDWFGSYAVSWIGLFILMCLSLLIISRVRETRN